MNATDFLFFDVLGTLLPFGALGLSLMLVAATVKTVPQTAAVAPVAAATADAPVVVAVSAAAKATRTMPAKATRAVPACGADLDLTLRDITTLSEPIILRSRASTDMRSSRPSNPPEHYAAA